MTRTEILDQLIAVDDALAVLSYDESWPRAMHAMTSLVNQTFVEAMNRLQRMAALGRAERDARARS